MNGIEWQAGEPPKDGTRILAYICGKPCVVYFDTWPVGGDQYNNEPPDGYDSGWCESLGNYEVAGADEKFDRWAYLDSPAPAERKET